MANVVPAIEEIIDMDISSPKCHDPPSSAHDNQLNGNGEADDENDDENSNSAAIGHHRPQNLQAQSQQLNCAFRVFIRIVYSHFEPLVMLDDLQWATAPR